MTGPNPDADAQRELADELVGLMKHHINPAIGWWRYADAKGEPFDRELLAERFRRAATEIQALIADAEKRAAAAALESAAREDSVSTHRFTPVEMLTLRVVRVDALLARSAALDPSGAGEVD